MKTQRLLTIIGIIILYVTTNSNAQKYHWQEPHAKVLPTGDLQWQPKPFAYPVPENQEVRYIDYENGSDENDGQSKDTPWQHHPWDTRATGKAAQGSGPMAYIFKKGVTYRIFSTGGEAFLKADESGVPQLPIRLTSEPGWGTGEAVIAGSISVTGEWQKATTDHVPARMNPERVWFIDLDKPLSPQKNNPIHIRPLSGMWQHQKQMNELILYLINMDGSITDMHIASDVGWGMTNPNFAYHHWNKWDGEADMNPDENEIDLQGYDEDLKGYEKDYFDGGTLWSQWGGIIATAHPYILKPGDYDPEKGFLAHRTYKHEDNPQSIFSHWVHKDSRYLIENLPQFLDKPGEYYFDEDYGDNSGRLFVRLPNDADPNQQNLEVSSAWNSIVIDNQNNIEISGLTFRSNGRKGHAIELTNNSSNIAVKNCNFRNLGNDGILAQVNVNEKMDNIRVADCDFYHINGGSAIAIQGHSGGGLKAGDKLGELSHVKVLRNRTRSTGLYRHNDHRWSNVPSITAVYGRVMEIAGNIIQDALGSGIVSQGGKSGKDSKAYDIPLIRILVHHNKIEYAALGACDYGGLSLWQHGPLYSYSNISGNSVGHWPRGLGGGNNFTNLSYPIYLDGAFKIYNFNNITWMRPHEPSNLYFSDRASFFNVFGYLNPLINSTIYGSGKGLGGTSGNRNNYIGNLFADITEEFISVNHGGNPSLIGGDDPGTSGIDGASTLAIGHNIFHGTAKAGTIATVARGAKSDLQADEISVLQQQMQQYPVAFGQLGTVVEKLPIRKPIAYNSRKPFIAEADFRLNAGSEAIDKGVDYFVPWALYATVAEWHFNQNQANPQLILDYHHYPTQAYFHRSMYHKVPVFELEVNEAELEDYAPSASENWVPGALKFEGNRYASIPNSKLEADVLINIKEWQGRFSHSVPSEEYWEVPTPLTANKNGKPAFGDDQYLRFPGKYRKTMDIKTNNFLVETIMQVDKGHKNGGVLGKHDGQTGYTLAVDKKGKAVFTVSAGGKNYEVSTGNKINDGKWHHLIAEVDRKNGNVTMYLDGKQVARKRIDLPSTASLSNKADYFVGRDNAGKNFFEGAIDFMRISLGTLADAETDIAELYEWQTNGPVNYDFAGNKPQGSRDAGALEKID